MADAALQRDYAEVFDGRLPFRHRPALLLVDVVSAYLEPESPLYGPSFAAALAVSMGLAEKYQAGGADGGLFFRKAPALRAFQQGGRLGAFRLRSAPNRGRR